LLTNSNYSKSFDSLSDYLSFPTFLEMFKGDIIAPNLYSELAKMSIGRHPLRLSLRETFLDTDVEALFNRNSFFNEETVSAFKFEGISSYIESSANIKNNVDNIVEIFPHLDELVGEMDLAARYGEEELEE
jgi:hypothetical protein